VTKSQPEHALGIGRLRAHLARELALSIGHCDSIISIIVCGPHPRKGEGRRNQPAPPASVCIQASPQALASSRTRRM
jgi:hypothetical protein